MFSAAGARAAYLRASRPHSTASTGLTKRLKPWIAGRDLAEQVRQRDFGDGLLDQSAPAILAFLIVFAAGKADHFMRKGLDR